jgi:hypothetical protein
LSWIEKEKTVKALYVIFIIGLFNISFALGQNHYRRLEIHVPEVVCHGSHETEKSFVPPPAEFLLKSGAEKKSDFIVDYSLFPPEAIEAFEYAVSIWESIIESDIPIYVEARWRTMSNGSLGSASPGDYIANFKNAPRKNIFYPIAVAEKLSKTEISGASFPDISATFNKDIRWYFKTDGKTPELLYDFVSVALHEIGHGLGFTGFFFVTSVTGAYGNENAGDVAAYDLMVINKNNQTLTDTTVFDIPSTDLYSALTSNELYSASRAAKKYNSGNLPRLYAPQIWNRGSSIYHLNDATYPSSNENSLMTHALGLGEAIHDPGPIATGILADIGWKHTILDFDKPKDIEQRKNIEFNLSIESDTEIDSNAVYVYYSYDSFNNHRDSLLLEMDQVTKKFSNQLEPAIETGTIQYYISVVDELDRMFYSPTEVPSEMYTVTIGPDTEPPVITHEEIPYFVLFDEQIKISTLADDNLGIDSVYLEWWLNDVKQQTFKLNYDSATMYSGFINYDSNLLNDRDKISYRISAVDLSQAKNLVFSPADSLYSFRIEKIFEPVYGYINDFNVRSNDFIIYDFDIYTAEGFENGSLHSPHPYPSPRKNNTYLNFYTLLKYPIILTENSTMRFDEIVLIEPGEPNSVFGDDDFWDYAVIEGSNDFGKTWHPVTKGYDSGEYASWSTSYNKKIDDNQMSLTPGSQDLYITRQINLLENGNFNAGDTILFRFRLFSDPYANGWGWTIDNLRIQTPVSAPSLTLSPGNIMVYPNPVNDILNISVQAEKNIEILTVELFNIYGQKLESIRSTDIFGEFRVETNLGNYNSGMYLVVIKENNKQVYSKKIVKN